MEFDAEFYFFVLFLVLGLLRRMIIQNPNLATSTATIPYQKIQILTTTMVVKLYMKVTMMMMMMMMMVV